jgi:FkbM family methyltransferase
MPGLSIRVRHALHYTPAERRPTAYRRQPNRTPAAACHHDLKHFGNRPAGKAGPPFEVIPPLQPDRFSERQSRNIFASMELKAFATALLRASGLYHPLRSMRNVTLRPDWWIQQRRIDRFFRPFFKPDGLVFDIGAHKGALTERFVRLGARVVAVEPQPECNRALLAHWGEVECGGWKSERDQFSCEKRVMVVPAAVGAAVGCAPMAISRASQVSSLNLQWPGRFPNEQWIGQIEVPLVTLDVLIERFGYPQFCKIDVEGFEPEVLNGLHTPIPVLSLEFSPSLPQQTVGCLRRLDELGYRGINYSLHLQHRFALPRAVTPAQAIEVLQQLPPDHARIGGDLYAFL